MTDAPAEARDRLREIVGQAGAVKRSYALWKAARDLKIPASRAKTIFYGEARRIDAAELDAIRALSARVSAGAAERADRERDREAQTHDLYAELTDLRRRLIEIEARLGGPAPSGESDRPRGHAVRGAGLGDCAPA